MFLQSSILGPVPSSAPSGNSHFLFNRNHKFRKSIKPKRRSSKRLFSVRQRQSFVYSIYNCIIRKFHITQCFGMHSSLIVYHTHQTVVQLSSARSSPIPKHIRNTLPTSQDIPTSLSSSQSNDLSKPDEPHSAPMSNSLSWHTPSIVTDNLAQASNSYRLSSNFLEPSFDLDDDNGMDTNYDHTIRRPLPIIQNTSPASRNASVTRPPMYAIATPPPTLMFAIASDNVDQVRQVLENGDSGPNDLVGPQSALAFALTSHQLAHKIDIVKTLLAYGADPAVLKKEDLRQPPGAQDDDATLPHSNPLMDTMDPATKLQFYSCIVNRPDENDLVSGTTLNGRMHRRLGGHRH